MLHRLESNVQIAYFESFEALNYSRAFWNEYLKHFRSFEVMRSKFPWEKRKVGIGPPPIKTDRGWLVIYHGVSIDRTYRAGAVLLDLQEPRKVLARTKEPILEPEMEFEKQGVVPNVVFPDGAVVQNGQLLAYYGGADKVCCVASAPIERLPRRVGQGVAVFLKLCRHCVKYSMNVSAARRKATVDSAPWFSFRPSGVMPS